MKTTAENPNRVDEFLDPVSLDKVEPNETELKVSRLQEAVKALLQTTVMDNTVRAEIYATLD